MENNKRADNFDNAKRSQFKADRLETAEREMYYDQVNSINPGHFNTETMDSCTKELESYHQRSKPFDHNSYLTDMIVDERIRKNHMTWVEEVTPWAGTASIVGATEFNPGEYLNFQGLRRPRGVQQIDPWQITEIDEDNLSGNQPFML
jgi:hypothetical protein